MNTVAAGGFIDVEVVYAEPDKQLIKQIRVQQGITAIEAVKLSNIRQEFGEMPEFEDMEVGIFSKRCRHDDILMDGDRVEIYRPLLIDPKEARRLKAEVAAHNKVIQAET